jgi:hypothetical protein
MRIAKEAKQREVAGRGELTRDLQEGMLPEERAQEAAAEKYADTQRMELLGFIRALETTRTGKRTLVMPAKREAQTNTTKETFVAAHAAEIEARRKLMQGRATGSVVGRDVDLQFTGVRCVGTYTNPLRGKYAGRKMSELPDHYVEWGNRTLTGWVQKIFGKELVRRWKGRTTC